jgi:hypothetical protein
MREKNRKVEEVTYGLRHKFKPLPGSLFFRRAAGFGFGARAGTRPRAGGLVRAGASAGGCFPGAGTFRGFWGRSGRFGSPAGTAFFIGHIKTGTLKDYAAAAVDKPPDFPAALGADLNRLIAHALKDIKGVAAAFTFILIGRHKASSNFS